MSAHDMCDPEVCVWHWVTVTTDNGGAYLVPPSIAERMTRPRARLVCRYCGKPLSEHSGPASMTCSESAHDG